MAPRQDLEQLIVTEREQNHSQVDGPDEDVLPLDVTDGTHVIVIPSTTPPGKGDKKDKHRKRGGKQGQTGGPETPRNCPHLETALFFFGIAGMIVSLVMLLLHFLRKIIPYY